MKTRYIYILASTLITIYCSCNKTTGLNPIQEIADDSYWKTADQFKLATNEFYTYERTFVDILNDNPHAETRSDLITQSSPNSFSNGTNAVGLSDANYNNAYSRLRSINFMLDRASKYANPTEIANYVAQAKFFRAYVYFDLLQQFGGVPVVLRPLDITSGELQAPRNTRDQVVDQIIKDLEDAISTLSVESAIATTDKGRISKGAAQSLLARVSLYEGTWQKFRNGDPVRYNSLLSKAVTNSDAVITSNEYYLFGTQGPSLALADSAQKYMFILEDTRSNPAGVTKSANKEYIMANRYDQTLRQIRTNITQGTINGSGNWPTRKLVTMYLCKDGLPIEKSPLFKGYATRRSEFDSRDSRMRYTLVADGNYSWDNKSVSSRINWLGDAAELSHSRGNNIGTTGTGYANQKWASERLVNDNEESYDYPVIRYAEVLLTYAEAIFERDGSISDADLDKSLNKVRLRPTPTMPKLSNSLVTSNGLDMRTEIRRERSVELYFEGFRIDDLKRWKTAEIEMPKPVQGITWTGTAWQTKWPAISGKIVGGIYTLESGRLWADKNYLLPIPSQQIQINPNIQQNPGWQ